MSNHQETVTEFWPLVEILMVNELATTKLSDHVLNILLSFLRSQYVGVVVCFFVLFLFFLIAHQYKHARQFNSTSSEHQGLLFVYVTQH